uniref:Uncharacterized protein n=1 Tax=Tetradesmus obliquus TaxID=3088 RepID=A0A383VW71_TETOB|eukprot:jgi/Sobl393_1/15319/SZX69160.1
MRSPAATAASGSDPNSSRHTKRSQLAPSSSADDVAVTADQGSAEAGSAHQLAPEGSSATAAAAAKGSTKQQQQQQSAAALLPSASELQQVIDSAAPAPAADAALTPAAAAAAAGPPPEAAAAAAAPQDYELLSTATVSTPNAADHSSSSNSSSSSRQQKHLVTGYKSPPELTSAPSKGKVTIAGRRLATGELVGDDVITLADYSAAGEGAGDTGDAGDAAGMLGGPSTRIAAQARLHFVVIKRTAVVMVCMAVCLYSSSGTIAGRRLAIGELVGDDVITLADYSAAGEGAAAGDAGDSGAAMLGGSSALHSGELVGDDVITLADYSAAGEAFTGGGDNSGGGGGGGMLGGASTMYSEAALLDEAERLQAHHPLQQGRL